MNLRILYEARCDADGIVDRLNDAEVGLGDEFTAELEIATNEIRASPRQFSPTDDGPRGFEIREFLIRRFNQRVIFVVGENEIVIVAIVHTSRQPGIWRRRISTLGQ